MWACCCSFLFFVSFGSYSSSHLGHTSSTQIAPNHFPPNNLGSALNTYNEEIFKTAKIWGKQAAYATTMTKTEDRFVRDDTVQPSCVLAGHWPTLQSISMHANSDSSSFNTDKRTNVKTVELLNLTFQNEVSLIFLNLCSIRDPRARTLEEPSDFDKSLALKPFQSLLFNLIKDKLVNSILCLSKPVFKALIAIMEDNLNEFAIEYKPTKLFGSVIAEITSRVKSNLH